jgi:hypothetical protein
MNQNQIIQVQGHVDSYFQLDMTSLLEQLLPTEMGLMQSLGESKTLIIMLVVFLTLFGGLGLFLLKMSA